MPVIEAETIEQKQSPDNSAGEEMRDGRRRRHRVRSRVLGWLLGQDTLEKAREILVRDVSRLGVGFESSWMPRLEQMIKIRIGMGPMRLARAARVVNVRRLGNGTFCVGAEFC